MILKNKRLLYISAGVRSPGTSFSSQFYDALLNAGVEVPNITLQYYIKEYCHGDEEICDLYSRKIKAFKMSKLPQDYDIYFCDAIKNLLINDLPKDKLVIYYHRDLFGTFMVNKPDVVLFRFCGTHPILIRMFYPQIYRTIPRHPFFFAIDPKRLKIIDKDILGVSYVGPRFDLIERQKSNFVQQVSYDSHIKIMKYLQKNKITGIFEDISRSTDYWRTVPRLQARIIIPADYSYETRVIYETGYMKTVMILYVQNQDAENVYKQYGLERDINYIGFSKPEELDDICKNLESYNLKKMVKKTHNIILKNHTFEKRVEQFMKIIERYNK